jgi:hypothetical protein
MSFITEVVKFAVHHLAKTRIVGGLIGAAARLFRNPWVK